MCRLLRPPADPDMDLAASARFIPRDAARPARAWVDGRPLFCMGRGGGVLWGPEASLDVRLSPQMNDNLLDCWSDLDELKGARSLETVYLERNPLQRDPQYRRKVMLALPSVRQIDATFVRF